MLDDKQSSIVRPKAVPPMFTPVSTTMQHQNRPPQPALIEMGSLIRKIDREATRIYDCIGSVKVFAYNSNESRWENSPNIEGNLCIYEKQQILNNKMHPSYAFAIINGDKNLIQTITSDMAQHADKLRLFYEVARNGRREVFCLHFLNENECLRLHTFLTRCIQVLRHVYEQQTRSIPIDSQTQINGQATLTNVYRQPNLLQNSTTPQFGTSRINFNQTPTRLTTSTIPIDLGNVNLTRTTPTRPLSQVEISKPIEQTPFSPSPIPMTNGNNIEDPTLSLKRLLNIRGQSGLENVSLDDSTVYPKQQQQQQNLIDLMPPSAFEPIQVTPTSPVVAIGAERVKHRLSTQLVPTMSREHFRNVLLHLVQTDDHFLDIIYQACLTHPPTSQ